MIWQSLWSLIALIKAGCTWRVGDGSSISIWHDKWVPRQVPIKIQSTIKILSSDAAISELINEEECCWKIELLFQIFQKDEVELISKTPLSKRYA